MDSIILILITCTSLICAIAQVLMKKGLNALSGFTLSNIYLAVTNPFLIGGVFLYGISMILYLVALSRGEVSYVYPLVSISYIFASIIAWFFLGEQLGLMRAIGIFTIIFGVFLVVR